MSIANCTDPSCPHGRRNLSVNAAPFRAGVDARMIEELRRVLRLQAGTIEELRRLLAAAERSADNIDG